MRREYVGVALSVAFCLLIGLGAQARLNLPGVVPPSGCFTSGVMSTDQFTSTGFSQSRTIGPNASAPAGAWVIEDDSVTSTGVLGTTNCPPSGLDGLGTYVVGLKITPTIVSWQEADVQKLKLIRDNNLNGLYEEGLDPVLQIRSGEQLASSGGVTFFNGPQSAIFTVPSGGAIGILVVVEIGPDPVSGSRFGLSLEAQAADVPTFGTISSGFASARNPAGSSIRLRIIGGQGNGGGTPPGGGGSTADELQPYDTNPSNGLIDDPEFLQVVNDWIDTRISDEVFFTAMDLWVKQKPISSASVGAGPRVQVRQTSQSVRFRARDAASMAVSVYGLDGDPVFQRTTHSDTLSWNLRTRNGAPVANGLYLYRATLTTVDGQTVRGDLRKLAVQR